MPERQLPACPPAHRPQSFLSFDFGTRRVGAGWHLVVVSSSDLHVRAISGIDSGTLDCFRLHDGKVVLDHCGEDVRASG